MSGLEKIEASLLKLLEATRALKVNVHDDYAYFTLTSHINESGRLIAASPDMVAEAKEEIKAYEE